MSRWPGTGPVGVGGYDRPVGDGYFYRNSTYSRIVLTQANASAGPNTFSGIYQPLDGHNRLMVVFNFSSSTLATSGYKVELGIYNPLQQVVSPQFGTYDSGVPTVAQIAKQYTMPDGAVQVRLSFTLSTVFTIPAQITVISWREVPIG